MEIIFPKAFSTGWLVGLNPWDPGPSRAPEIGRRESTPARANGKQSGWLQLVDTKKPIAWEIQRWPNLWGTVPMLGKPHMLRDPKNDTWYDRNICRSSEKNGFGGLFQYISLPTIGSKSFDTDIAYYSQLLEPSLHHEEFVREECMHWWKPVDQRSVGTQTYTGGSDACTAPRLPLTAPLKLQGGQSKVCELCRLQKTSKSPKKQVCIGPIQRPGKFSCYTSVFLSFTCPRSCSSVWIVDGHQVWWIICFPWKTMRKALCSELIVPSGNLT